MSLNIAGFEVVLSPTIPPGDEKSGPYEPFKPSRAILEKGFRRSPDVAAFQVDTIFEKDVSFVMRDGVRLYADIFRPTYGNKVPAIIMWSPYGKSGNGQSPDLQWKVHS